MEGENNNTGMLTRSQMVKNPLGGEEEFMCGGRRVHAHSMDARLLHVEMKLHSLVHVVTHVTTRASIQQIHEYIQMGWYSIDVWMCSS
jgi:hypothetical protein